MANITLHNDKDASATYVSNHFIDHYMTAANGEYVKIYLYLLRCMNSIDAGFSLSAAADRFEHTEKDIQRALKYWEKMKLLQLEYDSEQNLSGIRLLGSNALEKSADTNSTAEIPEPDSPVSVEKRTYTAAELAAFQEKECIKELLFVTEHYLKRPLTPTDINTILFWYDELQFPVDLIEYLIEYCLGKGHISLNYMNKVALGWKKENVTSVERAKCVSSSFSQLHFSVMKALGITGRNLVPAETACIDVWSKKYGFTQDIIVEACQRTIAAIHQPSIEYADGILKNWHKQKVHHLSDIVTLDSSYQNQKKMLPLQTRLLPRTGSTISVSAPMTMTSWNSSCCRTTRTRRSYAFNKQPIQYHHAPVRSPAA